MIEAFNELEGYIHYNDVEPALVKAALVHYQFEAIHPFIDGNGRVGRALLLRMLVDAELIPAPILPISDVLRARSNEYYAFIEFVEFEGDYENWVRFIINVVTQAARTARELIEERRSQQA